MLQSFDGSPSHIHTTLHPIGDEGFDIPTQICNDGKKIKFVTRKIDNRTVGTVACDMIDALTIETPNIYNHIYVCAIRDKNIYLKE
jgi:hypothetical protein